MKALLYDRFGPTEVLRLAEQEPPRPAPGEVVVEVAATSVNVIDIRVRKGLMGPLVRKTFPKIPGADIVGVVVRVGEGVSDLRPGEQVFGATDPFRGGAFAEQVAVPARQLAPLPPGLPVEQAATLPIAGLAALTAMRDLARLRAGDRVLVHGGSGAVGLFAIQIARRLGARVTAVSGAAGLDAMREAGADTVLDYRTPVGAAPQGPFEAILDASGAMPYARGAALLTPAGRLVEPSPTIPAFLASKIANLLRRRQHLMLQTVPRRAALEEIGAWAAAGTLRCPVAQVFDFAAAVDAIALMERGGVVGKVVVTMRRTA